MVLTMSLMISDNLSFMLTNEKKLLKHDCGEIYETNTSELF